MERVAVLQRDVQQCWFAVTRGGGVWWKLALTLRVPCHVTSDGAPSKQCVRAGEGMPGWPMASSQQSPVCGKRCCLPRTGQSHHCYETRVPRAGDSLRIHFAQRQTRPRRNRTGANICRGRFNVVDVRARLDRRIAVTTGVQAVASEAVLTVADCRLPGSHRSSYPSGSLARSRRICRSRKSVAAASGVVIGPLNGRANSSLSPPPATTSTTSSGAEASVGVVSCS